MEVATTNNHSHQAHHSHHHHQHHHHQLHNRSHHQQQQQQQQQQSYSSNGLSTNGGTNSAHSPFQREVREWQRIDPDTGALLTGRLEADRWINGPLNSYGKISDSQNISQPNGTQHTHRKQLEVLQARTANGAMQVIRAQTVQTTSSRWSSATSSPSSPILALNDSSVGVGSEGGLYHSNLNSHFSSPHLVETSTNGSNSTSTNNRWPMDLTTGVNICEANDNDYETAATASSACSYLADVANETVQQQQKLQKLNLINGNSGHNNTNSINGSTNYNQQQHNNKSNNNKYITNRLKNHFLLLDTAPSLKLSNLMKSSSSISSNNSSNSNHSASATTTTQPSTMHTHKSVGKVSLHAIVGGSGGGGCGSSSNSNNNSDSVSSTPRAATPLSCSPIATATTTTAAADNLRTKTSTIATWQQQSTEQQRQQQQQLQAQQRSSRLFEQPTLYGNSGNNDSNNNDNLTKSRVGVSNSNSNNNNNSGLADLVGSGDVAADASVSFANDVIHHKHYQHQHHQQQPQQHQKQSNESTPTHQLSRQPRRDLESFRHYNNHGHGFAASANNNHNNHNNNNSDNSDNDDDDDDDELRLTARHQRRQQNPFTTPATLPLQRSRSISTDDLSSEWDREGVAAEEPGEWRRVSKLRRSFQSTSTTATTTSDTQRSPLTPRRPLDLPTSSISVAKIRAELENGRRLNTAMRNNHVDLAALDSILNGPSEAAKSNTNTKRASFLTAESLKEIRGKLKRLSNEDLYKDDFLIAHQQPPTAEEQIEVQEVKKVPVSNWVQVATDQDNSLEPVPKSAFHSVRARHKPINPTLSGTLNTPMNSFLAQRNLVIGQKHNTNSLESRQKSRESATSEWHLRRKSYGFEKMTPADESRSMFRMDASTDSGLGRSGELSNWSPTETTAQAVGTRSTVVHFGESNHRQRENHAPNSPSERDTSAEVHKRHSIAVDECQYVRDNLRKTSQVHLNGLYETSAVETNNRTHQEQRTTQQKRVEFCKTEVHFAAESGRVNIVETDGKPPPTNNFRRRRRTTSGQLQSLTPTASNGTSVGNVAIPTTHFGDDQPRHKTIASSTVAYRASLVDESEGMDLPSASNVTVSIPKVLDTSALLESARNSYASTSGVDTTDGENDEISAIRGILKNKPIKPKPYHLGENIENANALWGTQLKSFGGLRSHNNHSDSYASAKPDATIASDLEKSVAERVRIVEQRAEQLSLPQTNGYSTKINLSLGENNKEWADTGATATSQRRPNAQELMLQDLREHQRILDEGLKSTSLIIRTMRSATEFDEAMRRLSIASMEAAVIPSIVVPTPMLRSNSYQEPSTRSYTYASTGTATLQTGVEEQQLSVFKSASFDTSTSYTSSYASISALNQNQQKLPSAEAWQPVPTAAPRLKLLGNTEIPVSKQLTQLRRLYEVAAATQHDDDSADEEVKSYFRGLNESSDSGGGTQESSSLEDERTAEYSSSWSRLKAKRTVWKIETTGSGSSNHKIWERRELPKSNVMSIELHSPQATLRKPESLKLRSSLSPPIAKPRIVGTSAPHIEAPQSHRDLTNQSISAATSHTSSEPSRDQLKIIKEARGARKLREHELSYFGVQSTSNKNQTDNVANNAAKATKSLTTTSITNTPKRTLLQQQQRKLHDNNNRTISQTDLKNDKHATTTTTTKWQLINDKPDLLRHSPIAVEPEITKRTGNIRPVVEQKSTFTDVKDNAEEADFDEHFYENITNELTPIFKVKTVASSVDRHDYDRKMDLKRDAMILNEMTRNADQTMKALTDEAALKDQRRRSLQRRKPLETIDEKMNSEKINDKCIAVQVTRSTVASEARRAPSHHTPSPTTVASRARSSSQSSVESCPRARSHSLSSEHEYENLNSRTHKRATTATKPKCSRNLESRSSSRESQHSARTPCSSGEDDGDMRQQREARRAKSKRLVNGSSTRAAVQSGSARKQTANETTPKKSHRTSSHHRRQQATGASASASTDTGERQRSTTHSSRRERTECTTAPAEAEARHHHHHHHQAPQRTADGKSSLSRRRKEADEAQKSIRASEDKPHKHGAGLRLVRTPRTEHEAMQRASTRSERDERHARARGHSSRSSATQLNTSALRVATPTKTHEHRTSTSTATPTTPKTATTTTNHKTETSTTEKLTHSKNTMQHAQQQHLATQQQQPQPQVIQHSLTTATITAKQRERHGKDRK